MYLRARVTSWLERLPLVLGSWTLSISSDGWCLVLTLAVNRTIRSKDRELGTSLMCCEGLVLGFVGSGKNRVDPWRLDVGLREGAGPLAAPPCHSPN